MNNTAYYSNPKVDANIMRALTVSNRDEKTTLYKEAQETIWKDAPWAFLVTANNVYVRSKNLSGAYVQPDTSLWFGDIDLK